MGARATERTCGPTPHATATDHREADEVRKILGFGAAATCVAALAGALGVTACRPPAAGSGGAPVRVAAGEGGAPDGRGAVERFLRAAGDGDTRAMSLLFGTAAGPVAARDPANEVEKRMRALACYLRHDRARVVDEYPGAGQERVVRVELAQRELTRATRFTVVPGGRERWYVQQFDIEPLADFCRAPG